MQLSIQTHPRFALICFHYFAFPSIFFPFFPCSFPCISFHLLPLFIHVHCIFLSLFFSFPSNSFHFLNFPAVMCSCSFIVLSLFFHFLSLFFHYLSYPSISFQFLSVACISFHILQFRISKQILRQWTLHLQPGGGRG